MRPKEKKIRRLSEVAPVKDYYNSNFRSNAPISFYNQIGGYPAGQILQDAVLSRTLPYVNRIAAQEGALSALNDYYVDRGARVIRNQQGAPYYDINGYRISNYRDNPQYNTYRIWQNM